MAGGMGGRSGRRGGLPLDQRVRSPGVVAGPACPARHCWVADPVDGAGSRRPALLLEWRVEPTGWQGRVVYAASLRAGAWALVEEWVPASLLTPSELD